MLILLGYLFLDPRDVDAFAADVADISAVTRAEAGCLFYGITLEDRPSGRFLVAERWQDHAALAAHLQRTETLAFLDRWAARMTSDLAHYDVMDGQGPAT